MEQRAREKFYIFSKDEDKDRFDFDGFLNHVAAADFVNPRLDAVSQLRLLLCDDWFTGVSIIQELALARSDVDVSAWIWFTQIPWRIFFNFIAPACARMMDSDLADKRLMFTHDMGNLISGSTGMTKTMKKTMQDFNSTFKALGSGPRYSVIGYNLDRGPPFASEFWFYGRCWRRAGSSLRDTNGGGEEEERELEDVWLDAPDDYNIPDTMDQYSPTDEVKSPFARELAALAKEASRLFINKTAKIVILTKRQVPWTLRLRPPNCNFVKREVDGSTRIYVQSKTEIAQGVELTVHYGRQFMIRGGPVPMWLQFCLGYIRARPVRIVAAYWPSDERTYYASVIPEDWTPNSLEGSLPMNHLPIIWYDGEDPPLIQALFLPP
ncbi:hypothetical protein GE09DRAFT_1067278 [Coniochaeta sp. 2T2.1]|nr:hypothetical protein GE09DRAFT_1067278 [Coniochaeta sp. 2T2.1]